MKKSAFVLSCFTLAMLPADLVKASSPYRYAYISYVDGELSIQRAAEPSPEPGTHNEPVMPGDRIWTHRSSFAEVRLAESSVLRLSEDTKVDFVELDSGTILRVWSGSVIWKLGEDRDDVRIDSPAGSVRPTTEGLYRIDVENGDRLALTVSRGAAELLSSVASVVVRSGETSVVAAGQPPDAPRSFNTASFDELDAWSERRDRATSAVRDVRVDRIPQEVRVYARDLSYHGDWLVDPVYGSVWYPQVSVGWAPYRDGRWCYTRYGYTWVSYEPWGWAPYHYGRWGHGHRGWYWIPGSTWAPAWVSFALGPFWVGWSPLGYHNEPVYRFHRAGLHRRGHRGRHGLYDDSPGWNFATRDEFPRRVATRLDPTLVQASASDVRLLDPGTVLGRDLNPRGIAREGGETRRGGWAQPARTEIGNAERTSGYRSRVLTSSTSEERSRVPVERGRGRIGDGSDAVPERGAAERVRGGRGVDARPVVPGARRSGREAASGRERPLQRTGSVEREQRGSGIVLRSRIGNGRAGASGSSPGLPEASARERATPRGRGDTSARPQSRSFLTEGPRSGTSGVSASPPGRTNRTNRVERSSSPAGRERSSRVVAPRAPAPRESGAVRSGARAGTSRPSSGARGVERGSPRVSSPSPPSRASGPSRQVGRPSSSAGASRGAGAGASRGTARSRPRENH